MSSIEICMKLARADFNLDVDLALPSQGVTVLFGPSGSGKTTLLRCIAGLERPAIGHLVVAGETWQSRTHWTPPYKRPLGYVFQEASLFQHLSVKENLRYGLRRNPLSHELALEQAIELLGIAHLLGRMPQSLSGGERQRASIARALAVSPRLLLMDEPLAALDWKRKSEILPYLEKLHKELRIPVIYVTHSPDEVSRLADYVVAMDQGRVCNQGPLSEVLAGLDVPFQMGEDVVSVIEASVAQVDEKWHLVRLDFAGGSLWSKDEGLSVGERVRVRILARDVSLAIEPGLTSIQNILPGRVDAVGSDEHPSLALVRVGIGGTNILARVTKRSVAALGLSIGSEVLVQIKSVAIPK